MEVQVRTQEMHNEAEYGVAAHWWYEEEEVKSRKGKMAVSQDKLAWLKNMANFRRSSSAGGGRQVNFFSDEVYVFTVSGEVVELPKGATPVDFAYAIHTDLGHSCTGAMVNDSIVPLDTALKSGDIVKIIIDKKRNKPSADWLKFVTTFTARDRIKTALNRERKTVGSPTTNAPSRAVPRPKTARARRHPKKRSQSSGR